MYKNLLENMTWSYSRVHSYEECPYQFYLTYVEKSKGEENYYGQFGSLFHKTMELYGNKEITIDECANYFIEHYDETVLCEVSQSTMDKRFEAVMDYFANFDESIIDNYEILGVEIEIHFKIDEYDFIGYIDLLLRDKKTKKLILCDYKSAAHFLKKDGTPLKGKEKAYKQYKYQLYLYCKAIFEKYGEYPSKLCWIHFLEQRNTVIPFDEKEYVKSIAWAAKIIRRIYKDEEFQALETKDYVLCGMLCDFRNVCPYRIDED